MIPINKVFASTVGRKFIMSLTGLGLGFFIVGHLVGNLQLLIPGGEMFNLYAHKLNSLGPLLLVIELGLAAVVLLHAVVGIVLWKTSADARDAGYALAQSKGGESRWNLSSRHMLVLGLGLLVFIVIHVAQFKYWAFHTGEVFTTTIDGEEVHDLYRLVYTTFQNPAWVAFYMAVMVFLGFHLRHGIWSMLQSIGAMPTVYSNLLYVASAVIGTALALGFFILPIYLYIIH
jgi:succinate dehydrogenase / fumarate reductase cytochrome b subunit